jgi:predicted secreted hydrolase
MADWSKFRVPELDKDRLSYAKEKVFMVQVVVSQLTSYTCRQVARKGFLIAKKHQQDNRHNEIDKGKDFLHGGTDEVCLV